MSEEFTNETVQIGCNLHIELLYRSGNKEQLTFDLVLDEQADIENGFLGISTPLAQALIGEKCGYLIPYFTHEIKAIVILSINKADRKLGEEKSKSRRKSIHEILNQIEYRDAVLFASSTDTKWGSYDADVLDYKRWKFNNSQEDDKEQG